MKVDNSFATLHSNKYQHSGLQVHPFAEPYLHAPLAAFFPSTYLSINAFEQYLLYPILLSQCTRQILRVCFTCGKQI